LGAQEADQAHDLQGCEKWNIRYLEDEGHLPVQAAAKLEYLKAVRGRFEGKYFTDGEGHPKAKPERDFRD